MYPIYTRILMFNNYFFKSSMTATFTLLDSCCIQFTELYHGSIGAQKIFGVISTIIFSFVGGILITWMTRLRSN